MSDIDELISEFENIDEDESKKLTAILRDLEYNEGSDLESIKNLLDGGLSEFYKLHRHIAKLHKKVYNTEDPDFISVLGDIHSIENKRENISDDIIEVLEEGAEYAKKAESTDDIQSEHLPSEDMVKKIKKREEKARQIENKIEDKLLKRFRIKALKQASDIIEHDRPHVKFRQQVLQELLSFTYKETYKDKLEAFGALKFEKVDGGDGREVDYVVEELDKCENYESREEKSVNPNDEFKSKVKGNNNLVSFHTHPPGSQKSHSGMDGNYKSQFNVLAVPERGKKIWVCAQHYNTANTFDGNWENLAIDVIGGEVPEAQLDKYNRAIKKSLAHKEMSLHIKKEHGNWDMEKAWNQYNHGFNTGGEKQWLRFVEGEEY